MLQKYYNLINLQKILVKYILLVYNLRVHEEECIKNKKKAQNITKIKGCIERKEKQNEKK